MNHFDQQLDRLADGELSPAEYQSLLASLDERDDGWKRCACALLEAQALRQELKQVVAATEYAPVAPATRPSRSRIGSTWFQALSLAACFGLAFWLGRGTQRPVNVPSPDPHQIVEAPQRYEALRPSHVELVVNDASGHSRQMLLPVVDEQSVSREELLGPPSLPKDVVSVLENAGHRVETRREFLRRRLDGEHEVVVPVDRVRFMPAAQPMY
jgi:hypothetical protein